MIIGIAALTLLLANAASGANLTDVRVGVHKDYTRVVFQLDGVSPYRLVGLESKPEGGLLLILALDAGPIEVAPIRPAKSRHIQALRLRGGEAGGSQVRIRLHGDAEMKELVLRKPDRIVIDFYDPGAGVASLVSSLVASATVAQAPLESGELAAVSEPIDLEPAVDELSEPVGDEAPAGSFEEGSDEPLVGEVVGGVPEVLEPAAEPDDAFAGVEIGEVVAEEPLADRPPGTSPPPLDLPGGESDGSLLDSPVVLTALAGLAVVALLFALGRRRRADAENEAFSPLDAAEGAEPGVAESVGAERAEAERDAGFALAGDPEGEGEASTAEEVAVSAADESTLPPAGEHDIDLEAAGEVVVEGTEMNQDTDSPTAAVTGGGLPTPPLAALGQSDVGASEVAKLVEEFDRRIAHLENRLEEVVDAKERLERQVSAQTEELRVQRAAIARTQRVLRTIARPDEEASEPVPKI